MAERVSNRSSSFSIDNILSSPSSSQNQKISNMLPRISTDLSRLAAEQLNLQAALYNRTVFPPSLPTGLLGHPHPSLWKQHNYMEDILADYSMQPYLWSSLFPSRYPYQKRKGGQVRFSNDQTADLEKKFNSQKYLSPSERKKVAKKLQLSERQVKTWFQNRRAKWRRLKQDEAVSSQVLEINEGVNHSDSSTQELCDEGDFSLSSSSETEEEIEVV